MSRLIITDIRTIILFYHKPFETAQNPTISQSHSILTGSGKWKLVDNCFTRCSSRLICNNIHKTYRE